MPIARFEMPDGRIGRFEVPEGTTPEQAQQMISSYVSTQQPAQAAPAPQQAPAAPQAAPQPERSLSDRAGDLWDMSTRALKTSLIDPALNLQAGVMRGAGSLGSFYLAPYDIAKDAMAGKGLSLESNMKRREGIDGGLEALGADTDSATYGAGKLVGEIAGTAGVGPMLAGGAKVAGASPAIVSGLQSGGLNVAGRTGLGGLLTRAATGATTGALAAGMVNPEDADVGAVVGGALPVLAKGGAEAFRSVGRSIGGSVSPEVAELAKKAEAYGIDLPADRIANSKPLNAVAASLEYVPFSGRAAVNERMGSQLNRAVARTMGQDTDNVVQAVKSARQQLGGEFDRVLQSNSVAMDDVFVQDLARNAQQASDELGSDGAKIIQKQVDEILAKAQNGQIDGQAAYNIKRTLDRIGGRNSPEAFYARELKKSLMGALERSLGADEAAAFTKARQQYGNMKSVEKLVGNGAEGDVSIARLANQRGFLNQDLQDLADISSQFLKTRESPHGALQRLVIGSTGLTAGAGLGILPMVAGGAVAGRGMNALLSSDAAKRAVTGGLLNSNTPLVLRQGLLGVQRAAPVLSAQ